MEILGFSSLPIEDEHDLFSLQVSYPTSNNDAFGEIMTNIESQKGKDDEEEPAGPPAPPALQSAGMFEMMEKALKDEGPALVSKTRGVYRFVINQGEGVWVLDLKNGNGQIRAGDKDSKADVTLTVGDDDFVLICSGKLNAQQAFMKGKLQLKGNMGLAMKLEPILKLARKKANL